MRNLKTQIIRHNIIRLKKDILEKTLFSLIIISFLLSCKDDPKNEIVRLVNEWQGKEIIFPHNMVFTKLGKDTIDYEFTNEEYKILIYIDSTGCTSCKLHFSDWKELIKEFDSITNKKTPFLFFLHPQKLRETLSLIKYHDFDYPICIDTKNEINKLNNFPKRKGFQSFLLNKKNQIIYIGNPLENINVRNLYLEEIAEETYQENLLTEIELTAKVLELGKFYSNHVQIAKLEIKNTGKNPLIINHINTSCGCIQTNYSKSPISPNMSIIIEVKYKAEQSGYFEKSMKIYGNIKNSFIDIKLTGYAKDNNQNKEEGGDNEKIVSLN